jgi:hypothetical protein
MLMDHYLKKKEFMKAALAAHEVMLQEFDENELSMALCLLSCINYIQSKEGKENSETIFSKKKEDNEQPVIISLILTSILFY